MNRQLEHRLRGVGNHDLLPLVTTSQGGFQCEITKTWPSWDICVLKVLNKITDNDEHTEPARAAAPLSKSDVYLGSAVGVFSRLKLYDREGNMDEKAHFSAGYVSMWMFPEEPCETYAIALSNIVIQKGFSGSPIFLPDGFVVGVIVRMLSFPDDIENPLAGKYHLPIMSPLSKIRGEIESVFG